MWTVRKRYEGMWEDSSILMDLYDNNNKSDHYIGNAKIIFALLLLLKVAASVVFMLSHSSQDTASKSLQINCSTFHILPTDCPPISRVERGGAMK